MNIFAIGLNHKTTPVELRERLAFSSAALCAFLDNVGKPFFINSHSQNQADSVLSETVVLSTCNRMEIYAITSDPQQGLVEIKARLSQILNIPITDFTPFLYILHQNEAIQHLMQVACGLDSLVLGEAQILGQVANARQSAQAHGAIGKVLMRLFDMAIHAGKRARTETGIGVNPASVSSVAVHLAVDNLGDLTDKTVMVLGAGEMGMLTLEAAADLGAKKFIVVNRTRQNAEARAKEWNAQPLTFDEIDEGLMQADLLITATGAPHTVIHPQIVAATMKQRPNRKLMVVDIALPRDVDDAVADISGIQLYNLDDLQHQVEDNMKAREMEIPKVQTIIDEEISAFMNWYRARDVVPTIATFRHQIEAIRQQELDRAFNRLPDLDERQQALIAELTHRLTKKFLHQPTVRLRAEAAQGNGYEYAHAINELFALDVDNLQ